MSTHTNYIWAVFLFYRKRYSGLPSLQNKCFLFLKPAGLASSPHKGILFVKWWSLHYVHFCWILDCQNDVVSKFSRDASNLLYWTIKIIGVVRFRCYHFRHWTSPHWDRRVYQTITVKELFFFLETEGFVVWTCSFRRIAKDNTTNPAIKAQACCITKKCWRAFCMLIWN